MRRRPILRLASLALLGLLALPLFARAEGRLDSAIGRAQGVVARDGMVVAQEALAARIGVDVLRKGGNAVDAAVAVGFALAVSYPRAGNIGGGGFMLIHRAAAAAGAAGGDDIAIDYRETAPQAITEKSFLDAQGNADPRKSRFSALAIGVPGTVAGLALAEEKYGSGRFTLAELIAPAIALARDGIAVTDDTADSLPNDRSRLARWPSAAKIFLKPDGSALAAGDRLVQSDLANSLKAVARGGPRAFYKGPIAEKLAAAVQEAGGVMSVDDLKDYHAVERTPVRGSYRGYDIVAMPPPSSGGVGLVEMLNILEGYDLAHDDEAQALFLMIEAMKRAYADRALFLGDPDAVQVPLARLISKRYAAAWRATIDPARATPASDIRAGAGGVVAPEGRNTTHFSVADRFGNVVANTYTLNFSYGLGLVAAGTGILLNNELDDFAIKPDVPNAYGLLGFSGQRARARQAAAVVDDADNCLEAGQAVPRHRLAGRQPHHHRGAAGRGRCDRPRHGYRGRRGGAARARSVDARSGVRRAMALARSHRRTAGARRQCRRQPAVHLGQLDHDHAGRFFRRRRRPAHARHARRGFLRSPAIIGQLRKVAALSGISAGWRATLWPNSAVSWSLNHGSAHSGKDCVGDSCLGGADEFL